MTGPEATSSVPAPGASKIEAQVLHARALMEARQFEQALALVSGMAVEVPENRDVLYMLAVNLRYLGHGRKALATLDELARLHPAFSRLYQEQGHTLRMLGERQGAIAAYRRAVESNPSLPSSWRNLAVLCREEGLHRDADHAASVAGNLARMPAAVVSANSMFAEGETLLAERLVREHLQYHPRDIEAMRLLGRIGMKMGVLDDAEFLLESVLEFDPQYHAARYDYAMVLIERQKHAQALEQLKRLLALDAGNTAFRTLQANALTGLGRHEESLRLFSELRADTPNDHTLHLAIGHAEKTIGHQIEAIESYRRSADVRPGFGDAWWSLANLKTYRFTDAEIGRMRGYESAATTSDEDRLHLCFALGKALGDRREFAESFAFYERGNELKRRNVSHDAGHLEQKLHRQMNICTSEFFAARAGAGCPADDPIFVVGLPRAGSTLIEQILASHSAVEGTRELADIPRLVHQLNGRESDQLQARYPQVLAELGIDSFRGFGETYLEDTRIYRTNKPRFIDKMPNNFRHIALIHLILPNARIIDARRDPMDCCFSNFRQLFANGQEFTYSLEDIGRYYRIYVEVMQHWDRVLPGRVLRVQHEQLIDDLEGSVRRMLDYCGLAFEPACLEFHRTERSVRTASSEQVRRPINREGVGQWRDYEPYLAPLKAALGDLVK
ncbi:MAG: tetratricopeptide repeat-containing sulfotransferase family protein [Steroidobacteraceae bacterium]